MTQRDPYLCERARAAIVDEAHVLGIAITLGREEARIEGQVETEEQRVLVEAIAQRVLGLPIRNRLAVVPPDRRVRSEHLR